MLVSVQLKESVTSLPELSRAIAAFETVDEIYRLMTVREALQPGSKIDFRRKILKDSEGGELSRFSVVSPPSITVDADDIWLAAILYVLKDYSGLKANVSEIAKDGHYLAGVLATLGEGPLLQAQLGARLFAEQLEELGETNAKWLLAKLLSARRVLHVGNVESVSVENDTDA